MSEWADGRVVGELRPQAAGRGGKSGLMDADTAFFRWLRKTGMAIAARMPMMMMTTRSSMRVKPSFSSCALRMRASIAVSSWDDEVEPRSWGGSGPRAVLRGGAGRGSWADLRAGPLAL